MSGTRNPLAKKCSHGRSKNLKAPKKNYFRHGATRSRRGRPIPEKKPPPANGQRLVFPRNKLNGTFEDNISRVPPIDTEMPKEELTPFWQILETVENYNTVKITQESTKRGRICWALICGFILLCIIFGAVAAPWLVGVGLFVGFCVIGAMVIWIQQLYVDK
jgi:hypothetical protein